MKKNTISGFIVFIVLIVVAAGAVFLTMKGNKTNGSTSYSIKTPSSEYVAAIHIKGQIGSSNKTYNQNWLLSTITKVKDDPKNLGIILYIDSPGGAVYQTDEVYLALQDYKKSGKKIYAYMGSMAASGGYYIACAADRIYANRNTLTGSIGVIAGQTFDLTGLFEKNGIKSETIHAGKNKNMGNYNEPLSEEQRAVLQSIADECYEQFTAIVANSRKIPLETVKKLADGRVYTAKQALDNRLIDRIDTWNSAVEEFLLQATENPDCNVVHFSVPENKSLFDFMTSAQSSFANTQLSSKLGLPLSVIETLNGDVSYPAFLYRN